MTQIKNIRWWIAGLLAFATALNYLDRQSFPVAASQIRKNIPLTDQQFWSANVQTLAADLFPADIVGSVEGLLGSAGSFGGMLFGLLVGYMVTHYGYTLIFLIAGLMHPVALLLILALVRRIEPVRAPGLTNDGRLSVVGS